MIYQKRRAENLTLVLIAKSTLMQIEELRSEIEDVVSTISWQRYNHVLSFVRYTQNGDITMVLKPVLVI